MPGPKGEECRKCYYWEFWVDDPDDESQDIGSCHRYPPSIPYEEDNEWKNQPTSPSIDAWVGCNSRAGYWCGEFKPRDA